MRPLLWKTVPSSVTTVASQISSLILQLEHSHSSKLTLHIPVLLVRDPLGLRISVAYQRVAADMLESSSIFPAADRIDGRSDVLSHISILVRERFDLNRVQRDESGLTCSLIPQVLDAIDCRLFLIHNDGIDIPPKNDRHSLIISFQSRFAQIDCPTSYSRKNSL